MSYLEYPRLIFSGKFQTDPSTVNNDPEHFNNAAFQPNYDTPGEGATNGWWNPKGSAAWRFRDCIVQQVQYTDGTSCDNGALDPVVGMVLNSVVDRVEGKLVDLDPEQQMVSAIWGFQVFLGSKDSEIGFGGDYAVASFGDIWVRYPQGTPDSFFGAYYQSVINLTKDIIGTADSRFLQELKKAIGKGKQLSIKFNVDGYNDDRTATDFTFGRITGVIGAAQPDEPAQFIAGRAILPAIPPSNPASTPLFNTAYAVQQGRFLHLDLGNSLPTTSAGGALQNFGNLYLATTDENGKQVLLGEVDYQEADWYMRTAGLATFVLDKAETKAIADHPLFLIQFNSPSPNFTFLSEAADGIWVRADQFVLKFNPPETVTSDIYATQFGQRKAGQNISFQFDSSLMESFVVQAPGMIPGPPVGTPTSILSFPGAKTTKSGYLVTTGANGVAKLSILAKDPGNPRGYIDGQVYGVAYQAGDTPPAVGQIQNPSQILNLLVFDAYKIPQTPTWIRDVFPIFEQYANLYPVMRRIVDLSNYGSVMEHRYILKNVFSTPETDPNYMPVTRDLSKPKREMLLKWLDNPVYFDHSDPEQLMMALQTAIELEHSTLPTYLTAFYSIIPGQNIEVANLIRSVIMEEMLHMALSCNILISLGGSPQIGVPGFVPNYPGSLPGGLRNDLTVTLKKCSIDQIRDVFMGIEMPENLAVERMRRMSSKKRGHGNVPNGEGQVEKEYYTIGWFYDQIAASLTLLSKAKKIKFGNADRQLSEWHGTGNLIVVTSLADALAAIHEIKEQGEGSGAFNPNDGDDELSHYYKFAEIVEGRQLVKTATGFAFIGPVIPFDPAGVYPMIDNPSLVIYPEGSRASLLAAQFTETYLALLQALHTTFNGQPDNIRTAIGAMYSMGLLAVELMQTPSGLVDGQNAGPQFKDSLR